MEIFEHLGGVKQSLALFRNFCSACFEMERLQNEPQSLGAGKGILVCGR